MNYKLACVQVRKLMNMHDSRASIHAGRVDRLDRQRQHVFPAWSAWLLSVSHKWSADCMDVCPSSKCRLGYYKSSLQRFQPTETITWSHSLKPLPETITWNRYLKPLPKPSPETIAWNHYPKPVIAQTHCLKPLPKTITQSAKPSATVFLLTLTASQQWKQQKQLQA